MRLISILIDGTSPSRTKHYIGLPHGPTEGENSRQDLAPASFLVIEETHDGIFLYRFDAEGKCAGDTWHSNIGDARHQASYEFGDAAQVWKVILEEVGDAVTFGLEQIASNRN